MHDLTIYQVDNQDITIVDATPPQMIDAAFLKTWLHGKSEKTQRAYITDMHKFYAHEEKCKAGIKWFSKL